MILKSKFQGAILGCLVGDCYGAPFKGDVFTKGGKIILQKYFDKLDGQYFKAPLKKYTEDSVMTKCVTTNLIENKKLEPTQLAKQFIKEYLNDPRRGYMENLPEVFSRLRASNFKDPYKPATEINDSSDNGAAMRISPVALFYHDNFEKMIDAANKCIKITHIDNQGVNGALLQCITVQQAMKTDGAIKPDKFCDELIAKMNDIETDAEGLDVGNSKPYKAQLEIIRDLIQSKDVPSDEEVIGLLGHTSTALYSVPTAVFCFLRAQNEIELIETSNPYRRTIQYAISLGGDTDTIANMSGSIAGAYYGLSSISQSMMKHCEDVESFLERSSRLSDIKNTM